MTGNVLEAGNPRPVIPVVHVSVEGFFAAVPGRRLADLLSLTDRLDRVLARYGDGWRKPSADEAVLTADARLRAGAKPLDWAGSLRVAVRDAMGLDCSVGIAATEVAARICSRIARPRGVLLWLSGYEEGLIAGLPIEELDELRPEQLVGLRAKGIQTLGKMACLGPDEARSLLGSEAGKLVGVVRGRDLGSRSGSGSRLERALRLLSRRLARRLAECGREARGLELCLSFGGGVAREQYTVMARESADEADIYQASGRLLAMSPLPGRPFAGLSLTATGLTVSKRSGAYQLDLFRRAGPREVTVATGRTGVARP